MFPAVRMLNSSVSNLVNKPVYQFENATSGSQLANNLPMSIGDTLSFEIFCPSDLGDVGMYITRTVPQVRVLTSSFALNLQYCTGTLDGETIVSNTTVIPRDDAWHTMAFTMTNAGNWRQLNYNASNTSACGNVAFRNVTVNSTSEGVLTYDMHTEQQTPLFDCNEDATYDINIIGTYNASRWAKLP